MIAKTVNGVEFSYDLCDHKLVLAFQPWYLYNGYVETSNAILLHNLIMPNKDKNLQIDHKNRNILDNTRYNLRLLTHSQNQFNRPKQANNTSGYKGVTLHKKNNKYVAHIRLLGKLVYLGSFGIAEEAARAYDKAAKTNIGEVAILNFPCVKIGATLNPGLSSESKTTLV